MPEGGFTTARPKNSLLIPILVGLLVAALAMMAVVLLDDGGGTAAATTTAATTETVHLDTTTTPTTTFVTTTSVVGSIATVTNTEIVGDPGPNLTDVRIGDHESFVRVVFDLTGSGTPLYIVGYASPPFTATSGDAVPVAGTAFLEVHISPALRYDFDTLEPTYTGDLVLDPGFAPIEQIVFVDDFETAMLWVIGLTAEKPFTVTVMQDPLRLVVDIAK